MVVRQTTRSQYRTIDIAIVCMIADTELRAIRDVMGWAGASEIEWRDSHDGEHYYELRNKNDLTLGIVVTCCDGQANLEAAITTQIVLFRHNPRYAFLCGIAGGMKTEKYKLGDVVIAPEVSYRRYTKVEEDGRFGEETFNVPPSSGGRNLAKKFFSSQQNLKKTLSPLNGGDSFAIHSEKILSWDLVLDNPETKAKLLSNDRQLAVVEMEGAGFLKAVESHSKNFINRPWQEEKAGGADALVVRGISDPAAGKAQSDGGEKPWRDIAARNAAHAVILILNALTDKDLASSSL